MKKIIKISFYLLVIGGIILFAGCKKENPKGKVVFWYLNSSPYNPNIVVTMEDGTVGNITTSYSVQPDCGASGCFTFEAEPGNYTFSYYYPSGVEYTCSTQINLNDCIAVQL